MEIRENKSLWDGEYHWNDQGDEWSLAWGGPGMQWYGVLLPRIFRFLPANRILELAPGFGRWTQYLKGMCEEIDIVDLSEECIESSKKRFSSDNNINYYVNDGISLEMIKSNSIDFLFSFDSLVHANPQTLENYIKQFDGILTDDGVAFIHHSNLKNHIEAIRGKERLHIRDPEVSAEVVAKLVSESGLQCITQELVNWGGKSTIDCITTITKQNSKWSRVNRVLENDRFMTNAELLKEISWLYSENC